MSNPAAELTASQMLDALALAGDLAACHRPAEINQQMQRLPALLGSDTVLIGEVHLPGDDSDAAAVLTAEDGPAGSYDAETQAVFMRLWHQHPVVSRHFSAPAPGALKISDFLTDRQWRRTELFGDCYGGRLGIGWEIATQIRFSPRTQACAALGRTNRDFDERDRAFLDLVNPHLRGAYARMEREAMRDSRVELLERGIESRGEAVVLVTRRGKIVPGGSMARAILRSLVRCPAGLGDAAFAR